MQEQEYTYLKHKILKLTGVDLACYKSEQMQRRLQAYLLRSGFPTWFALFRAIQNDPEAIGHLRDYLTINVSYFFRDPEKYKCLQGSILPELARGRLSLRVWSAGCSRGHEPYSLAILLNEVVGAYRPHQIIATDIDRSALEWAQAGGPYSAEEVAAVPAPWLERYFSAQEDGYWATRSLRRRITFCEHNLLAKSFVLPESGAGGYDLIVCRNVVIYFTNEGKDQLYQHLYDALRPGGVLFVGGTEIISKAHEIGLEAIEMSFYRRPLPQLKSPRTGPSGIR